jgi:hypothetical protein
MHVYVDESGDLGFSEKSTKFFVVAYVVCNSSTTLETNVKRVLKKLHNKGQYHFSRNELKFSRMSADCRKSVLEKRPEALKVLFYFYESKLMVV